MISIEYSSWPDSVRKSLADAKHAYQELEGALRPLARSFEQTIAENPLRAVAVSLATGVLLGWLVKR